MWTPKQLVTTQTFFFCSTGDEERLGGSMLTGETLPENHPLLGTGGYDDGETEWEPILWGLGHRGVVPDSDLKTRYTTHPSCTEALPSTTDSDGFATLLLDSERMQAVT